MRQLFFISGLLISIFATSQVKSLFVGEWHFFDETNTYCEWTVISNFLYQYRDSSGPTRQKITLRHTTLTISSKSKWTITENGNDFLLVNHHLKLFRKEENADTVKKLYDFLNEPHNGNGAMIFMREATERKQQLIDRIKTL